MLQLSGWIRNLLCFNVEINCDEWEMWTQKNWLPIYWMSARMADYNANIHMIHWKWMVVELLVIRSTAWKLVVNHNSVDMKVKLLIIVDIVDQNQNDNSKLIEEFRQKCNQPERIIWWKCENTTLVLCQFGIDWFCSHAHYSSSIKSIHKSFLIHEWSFDKRKIHLFCRCSYFVYIQTKVSINWSNFDNKWWLFDEKNDDFFITLLREAEC